MKWIDFQPFVFQPCFIQTFYISRFKQQDIWAEWCLSLREHTITNLLLDEKNVSEHKGAAGTHSPYMLHILWFLQAVKASGDCPALIMSRVTGTATAACGLCDEEPPVTLTCSIISLKTSMYVWGLLLYEAVSFILRREENGKNVTL